LGEEIKRSDRGVLALSLESVEVMEGIEIPEFQ
jgi:hypothetical protein